MFDIDDHYSIESEIDRAFPYIDKLDKEIDYLKIELKNKTKNHKKNFIRKLLDKKKQETDIIEESEIKRTYCKRHKISKDGYDFMLRTARIYKNDDLINPYYYEFFVNIKYHFETKNKQFYKKIACEQELNEYFDDMIGVFKHLTRRDLMERLFKEKSQEIEKLKQMIND